jgi:hypothetical protein
MNDEQATLIPDTAPEPPKLSDDFGCPKCGKPFSNAAALRMHNIRKHTKGWDTGKNFQGKRRQFLNRAERLAARRVYQQNLRDRYYREGRNSKGQKMPPGWKPNPHRQAGAIKRYKKSSYSANLTGAEREAYLQRQRKYQRNHYNKKRAEKLALREPTVVQTTTILTDDPVRLYGDAASAIVLAANVIRAVTTGLKIGGKQ